MHSVVLGLGSNIGHKLSNLRQAVDLISSKIAKVQKISPIYETKALLPEGAPQNWAVDYYNLAVLLQIDISPEELLAEIKAIEIMIGRDPKHAFWCPREIDIDILCYEDLLLQSENLNIPHQQLLERNFAIRPLLDVYPAWRHPNYGEDLHQHIKMMPSLKFAPFTLQGSIIMGIVNLSDDSFSQSTESVVPLKIFGHYILELVNQGAEIIDIGAESTKPQAQKITGKDYWEKLKPYLEIVENFVKSDHLPIEIKVSVDTYHAEVVKEVLNYQCVRMINDVYGIESKAIAGLLKQKGVEYIFMHQMGVSGRQYLAEGADSVSLVVAFAEDKIKELLACGMSKEKLIFDLGIGFAKHTYQAQCLLEAAAEIKQRLDIRVLVGHSRKASVMRYVSEQDNMQKDLATAMISRDLIKQGIDYIRVHNVRLTAIAKFI